MSSLNDVLELAERIGYITEPAPFSKKVTTSIQFVDLLDELLSLRVQSEKIKEILTKLKDSEQSFDLVKESEIERKISTLSGFSKHVESIMSNKQVLLMRLKDPFVGEHINLEPEYHKDFSELFPAITQSIALLPHDLRNLEWFGNNTVTDKIIDSQIGEISSLIAMYGNYSDSLDRVRKVLKDMQDVCKAKATVDKFQF
ncbi:6968_t:CDS:2 [Dentiscutata erythropus]|uniref:6968_t:CDS:1 n=1 Tax=Dentiscutata erythropus TaxID=1348616 RepID=A0A9N9E7E2_9GLOM|nr:6968_t:CDS:2 [Dentiscutata erythropus]